MIHTMHCALSLVSKGGNCILKASDVYHTENVKPNMTSKKCFHEKDGAQIPKLSVEKGGSGQPFLFKRRRLCLQKKKFESIFVAQQTEYVSTLMVFEESRSVENRLQRC